MEKWSTWRADASARQGLEAAALDSSKGWTKPAGLSVGEIPAGFVAFATVGVVVVVVVVVVVAVDERQTFPGGHWRGRGVAGILPHESTKRAAFRRQPTLGARCTRLPTQESRVP